MGTYFFECGLWRGRAVITDLDVQKGAHDDYETNCKKWRRRGRERRDSSCFLNRGSNHADAIAVGIKQSPTSAEDLTSSDIVTP